MVALMRRTPAEELSSFYRSVFYEKLELLLIEPFQFRPPGLQPLQLLPLWSQPELPLQSWQEQKIRHMLPWKLP